MLAGAPSSVAYAINDRHQVVGEITGSGGPRAVLWDTDGLADLGPLPGGVFSIAFAINKHGETVGERAIWEGRLQPTQSSGLTGQSGIWGHFPEA
jgi:uncharacterized membrane protein